MKFVRKLAVAWLGAVVLLSLASSVELHFRLGDALVALRSDYVAGLASTLGWNALWALGAALGVAALAKPWARLRRLGPIPLAIVLAVDAATRQVLGEAWLGALADERLDATVLPGFFYFGLLPTLTTGLVLLGVTRLGRRSGAAAATGGLALLAVGLLPVARASKEPPPDAPNLLLVTIDTWRYDHFSAHPRAVDDTLTPNLDALASRGTLFVEARAHVPITVPSHASMLSGRTPWEHGIMTNGGRVDPALPWLPAELQAAGWSTGAVVSGAVIRGRRGFDRGFDRFHDDLRDPPRVADLVTVRLGRLLRGQDDPTVFRAAAERAVRRAGGFLDSVGSGRPWFLWVHLYDVHLPHTVDAEAAAPFRETALEGLPDPCRYRDHPAPIAGPGGLGVGAGIGPERARERERRCADTDRLRERLASYRAEVRVADAAVGRLLQIVDDRGETGRTAVIVTADHGESLTEHGTRLAHQFSAYEPVLRVPLLVVPAGSEVGTVSDALVQHRDLPATALELLGRPDPTRGRSWLGSEGLPHVVSVVHVPFLGMLRAMRRRADGLPMDGARPPGPPLRVAVRDKDRSLVSTPGVGDELYDLSGDPAQVLDLVSNGGAIVPSDLSEIAAAVAAAVSKEEPERLDPDDPDIEALRALGYTD